MQVTVRIRRLFAATVVSACVVLGLAMLVGADRAQSSTGTSGTIQHTCSAPDKQFLQTVVSNMTQLSYWSDELQTGDATPGDVIRQTVSESKQIGATGPTDPSLVTARSLLRKMFLEYAAAVRAKALGNSPGIDVRNAYTLANGVHDLLVQEQPAMAAKGCDVTPLLQA